MHKWTGQAPLNAVLYVFVCVCVGLEGAWVAGVVVEKLAKFQLGGGEGSRALYYISSLSGMINTEIQI